LKTLIAEGSCWAADRGDTLRKPLIDLWGLKAKSRDANGEIEADLTAYVAGRRGEVRGKMQSLARAPRCNYERHLSVLLFSLRGSGGFRRPD